MIKTKEISVNKRYNVKYRYSRLLIKAYWNNIYPVLMARAPTENQWNISNIPAKIKNWSDYES
jgi:hypothetical protein